MIPINDHIEIDEDELVLKAVRASGPGGQHVNKTSTAVELRFDALSSPNLPEGVKARVKGIAGRRMNLEGVIVLQAEAHRSQERNRQDAVDRLVEILAKAAEPPPPPRKKTRPTKASKERRLTAKKTRGNIKAGRGRVDFD
jgi:ribosome-associated protein